MRDMRKKFFSKKLYIWVQRSFFIYQKIKNYVYNLTNTKTHMVSNDNIVYSSIMVWNTRSNYVPINQCPIATYNRKIHSIQNLLQVTSKQTANWINSINI